MKGRKHKILFFGNGGSDVLAGTFNGHACYELRHMSTVPETLSALIGDQFDLVLLNDRDVERDAIKLCRIIKSYHGFDFLPVVYIANTYNKHKFQMISSEIESIKDEITNQKI